MAIRLQTLVLVGILSMCASAESKHSPCRRDTRLTGWRVYHDDVHRFCFSYPSNYKPIAPPAALCRGPKLKDKKTEANIGVCVLPEDFNDDNLVKMAPTGIESPPEPVQIGDYTFHYYGPGGGGAQYPDGWYFNLQGKVLIIDFDGPYDPAEKTPTDETKKLERKVLATFRKF